MKLFIITFYREFEQSERDWDIAIGTDANDAIKRLRKQYKEENGLDDVTLEDMDFDATIIEWHDGYKIELIKDNQ